MRQLCSCHSVEEISSMLNIRQYFASLLGVFRCVGAVLGVSVATSNAQSIDRIEYIVPPDCIQTVINSCCPVENRYSVDSLEFVESLSVTRAVRPSGLDAILPEIEGIPFSPQGGLALIDVDSPRGAEAYIENTYYLPKFALWHGPLDDHRYGIETRMLGRRFCEAYTTIVIGSSELDSVEVSPVDDWLLEAGIDVVTALWRLRNECESMPPELANRRFQETDFLWPDGSRSDQSQFSVGRMVFPGCQLATQKFAYSIRVTGPDGDLVISNVDGELFLRAVPR